MRRTAPLPRLTSATHTSRTLGALVNECIRGTLHGALVRGYDVILVSDAHADGAQTAWGRASPPEHRRGARLYAAGGG